MQVKNLFFISVAGLLACSDPAEEVRSKALDMKADSLRSEIQATLLRIDSLRKMTAEQKQILDSLGMPAGK